MIHRHDLKVFSPSSTAARGLSGCRSYDTTRRAGRALQSKAEAEASLKYHAGLALLKELEAQDNKRAAVEICERAERERPPFELQ